MNIEIWYDFGCPFCYIGHKRLKKALEQFDHNNEVKITYQPYQVNKEMPTFMKLSPTECYSRRHDITLEETLKIFRIYEAIAKEEGLDFSYNHICFTNTLDAHRLMAFAKTMDKEDVVFELIMKAYFEQGINIALKDNLYDIAEKADLPIEMVKEVMTSDRYSKNVEANKQLSKQIGIQGVPFYVIDGEYGISGAQDSEYFLKLLKSIWQQNHTQNTVNKLHTIQKSY
ncbi:MAG: DsbA family oxidoreductase [Acholeplasma sp.]|nr:DsbA family oxidoreductase [Acholeplasma sp.]